tara:strand:- start:371 stop:571 length:201 start_codon:yes stop_codon:yes gene_type:complete
MPTLGQYNEKPVFDKIEVGVPFSAPQLASTIPKTDKKKVLRTALLVARAPYLVIDFMLIFLSKSYF